MFKYLTILLLLTGCAKAKLGACYVDVRDGLSEEIDRVEWIENGTVYYSYTFPNDPTFHRKWAYLMGRMNDTSETERWFIHDRKEVKCPW